jgi:thiol-disulfide isomerase/thioredoxin
MAPLNTPRSTWIALGVAVVMLAATWYPGLEDRFRQHKTTPIADVGQPANLNFTLKDLSGKDVTLSSFAGKIVILNFYATWCGPCRVETPDLVKLQQAHPDDVAVVGILWMDEDGDAKAFAKEFNIPYPMLNGNRRDDIDDAYGPIDGLPRSVVIGRDGKIAAIHEGATLRPTFERDLAKLK